MAPRTKDYNRRMNLKTFFNLTPEQVHEMHAQQDGNCGICAIETPIEKVRIDHNDREGYVRGLLCHRCNIGLGWFEDAAFSEGARAAFSEGARAYLSRHSAENSIKLPARRRKKNVRSEEAA